MLAENFEPHHAAAAETTKMRGPLLEHLFSPARRDIGARPYTRARARANLAGRVCCAYAYIASEFRLFRSRRLRQCSAERARARPKSRARGR